MIYPADIFRTITGIISEELTPLLQQQPYADLMTGIHFAACHEKEMSMRLSLMKGASELNKYPLIWLRTPFTMDVDKSNPQYQLFKGDLFFINGTSHKLLSEDRYDKNFKPIIHPIMEAFLAKVESYKIGKYKPFGTTEMSYTQIDHDYWGTQAATENEHPDFLDATELKNFTLKIKPKNC